MIDRGATIGLGCDAGTCSNNLDIVRAMYSSAIIFRDARRDMNAMPAEKSSNATLHGARCALQEADLGSLSVGKKADVVLFDATRPNGGRSTTRSPTSSLLPMATAWTPSSSTQRRPGGRAHADHRRGVRPEGAGEGRSVCWTRPAHQPKIAWPVIN